jgi:hypothetical protein
MPNADELRAALAVAELEEQLIAAKETDDGPSAELRAALREARQTFRQMREGYPVQAGEARPDAITATATVSEAN